MKSYSFSLGPKMDVLINEGNLDTELECCATTEAELKYTHVSQGMPKTADFW